MPLMADRNRIPDHFAAKSGASAVKILESFTAPRRCIQIALINNMPDAALEDTESQFFDLLATAAGELPVHISLYSLAEIPRGEKGRRHLSSFYRSLDDLWAQPVDAIIVTGTEPRQANLQQEPYWQQLTELFDWAEINTKSAVLSCLAAHAGVLYSDGIDRHPMREKTCGVFEQSLWRPHALTEKVAGPFCSPHSRWNEVREDELTACGYSILTKSEHAGVDMFVKKKRRSLFVHFQGHPEYGARTLLKEYRRDVGRFLREERDFYPAMPSGYFDGPALTILSEFRERALRNRQEDLVKEFPEQTLGGRLHNRWRRSAIGIYANWFRYLVQRTAEAKGLAVTAALG